MTASFSNSYFLQYYEDVQNFATEGVLWSEFKLELRISLLFSCKSDSVSFEHGYFPIYYEYIHYSEFSVDIFLFLTDCSKVVVE